eukprot:COSAG01_NODE_2477_length_7615_cov_7.259609_5_plen_129_part_00
MHMLDGVRRMLGLPLALCRRCQEGGDKASAVELMSRTFAPAQAKAQLDPQLLAVLSRLQHAEGICVERTVRFVRSQYSFVGHDAVTWLVEQGHATTTKEATQLCNEALEAGLIHHINFSCAFKNDANM